MTPHLRAIRLIVLPVKHPLSLEAGWIAYIIKEAGRLGAIHIIIKSAIWNKRDFRTLKLIYGEESTQRKYRRKTSLTSGGDAGITTSLKKDNSTIRNAQGRIRQQQSKCQEHMYKYWNVVVTCKSAENHGVVISLQHVHLL